MKMEITAESLGAVHTHTHTHTLCLLNKVINKNQIIYINRKIAIKA